MQPNPDAWPLPSGLDALVERGKGLRATLLQDATDGVTLNPKPYTLNPKP